MPSFMKIKEQYSRFVVRTWGQKMCLDFKIHLISTVAPQMSFCKRRKNEWVDCVKGVRKNYGDPAIKIWLVQSALAFKALCQHLSFSNSTGKQVSKKKHMLSFNQLHLCIRVRSFSPKGFSFSTAAQKCLILLYIKIDCIEGLLSFAKTLYIMKFFSLFKVNIFISALPSCCF